MEMWVSLHLICTFIPLQRIICNVESNLLIYQSDAFQDFAQIRMLKL